MSEVAQRLVATGMDVLDPGCDHAGSDRADGYCRGCAAIARLVLVAAFRELDAAWQPVDAALAELADEIEGENNGDHRYLGRRRDDS